MVLFHPKNYSISFQYTEDMLLKASSLLSEYFQDPFRILSDITSNKIFPETHKKIL